MHQACGTGIPITADTIRHVTLAALEARGLIHLVSTRKRRQLWRATDTGRHLIATTGLTPTFLHRHSQYGYTHNPGQALPREPEVIH